ncbi:MAG: HAMP domain-containing histidine kinase [Saccharofermentans sp.]|nr:HAMP domain-containing histidine kinase [Saccharofermentans sp.]
MRKRITDRLSFKVFLITFIIQVLFGVMIFMLLYNATPLSWNAYRRNDMETKFAAFVEELNSVPYAASGKLVDDFILSNDCHIVFYRGGKLEWDDYPASVTSSIYALRTREDVMKLINLDNNKEMVLSASGIVTFKLSTNRVYTVVCLWAQKGENVLLEAIKSTLPLIITAIVVVSLVCSFIYAYLFARPVRKLSLLSGKIAGMDFSEKSGSKRRDEIGDLSRDLDNLSSSLNETITDLNQRTAELEREINRVNELERQKEVFFLAASHELKTPITIAQGQVRGMIDGVSPYDDHDTYLPRTLSTLKRMESLINEILTVSRMQAGNEITHEKVDMTSLLTSRIEDITDLLEVREVMLVTRIDEGLYCEGNAGLISMAVGAFLSNAVYYSSEESNVLVNAREEDGFIVTEIRNTGSHIDEKDLPHLFEAFYRVDSSRNRQNGGSGLGLYLGKIIVERHGGIVSLENEDQDVVAGIKLPVSTENP